MHRLLATATLVAALALPLGAAALAGSAQETFAKFKPRFACACFETTPPTGGVIVQDGTGRIRCGIPGFDASGNLGGISLCSSYEVLGR